MQAIIAFAIIWLFGNKQARNNYFHSDETLNGAGKAVMDKVNGVREELEKLGTYTAKYTDRIVQ